LETIASKLRFPPKFFFADDLDVPLEEAASFRSLSKMTAKQRNMALAQGALALHLSRWIEARYELPAVDLPNLRHEQNSEAAAAALRQLWGIGQQPVHALIPLLESKGVRIFSLSIDALEVDAFSMWKDSLPFMFLNTRKSAEHSRFDVAHELGHLVLHRHGAPNGREAEREADAFASAFLMPPGSVRSHAPRFPILAHLIKLKATWGVSVSALTYRLHALGLLTDWHYRTLCIEISQRGFRKEEPESIERESSQALAKVFASLREERVSKSDIADDLGIDPSEIEELAFGLTIVGIGSSAKTTASSSRARPVLRIVK
jgi:Zn-dependent peptidase ImmA (M78 family)